jgi:hypothetical protein
MEDTQLMPMQPERTVLRFDHLEAMLTPVGLWQHAEDNQPNPRHGYSIDDEARGLIVGLRYWQAGIASEFYGRLAQTCFRFIEGAAIAQGECAGQYHNFCDTKGKWLDSVGSEDSFGRTLWGLGVAYAVDAPFAPRAAAEKLICGSLPIIPTMRPTYLRAKAFVILGLAETEIAHDQIHILADALTDNYEACADSQWHWFEDQMTYCNARLPQALFMAARLFPDKARYRQIAVESLEFLLEKTRNGQGSYDPIGNLRMTEAGWFTRRDQTPPRFDQQPVDTGALVECCAEAFRVTGDARFKRAADEAFSWYLGCNYHGMPVFNEETGGVSDALTPMGLNSNQGAESVLSVHLAYQALHTMAS